ncbi:MAG: cation:proton antiporter, partial [Actinobacteria bacterium]|nr:cation:proton antiporter [Actinomycetota bacterium]
VGLAAVVGAFIAGSVLAESRDRFSLHQDMQPVADLLTPFFFVVTGAQLNLKSFGEPAVLAIAAAITAVAIAGKLVGGLVGARSMGRKSALVIGSGMIPRGEVGIIVAGLALRSRVIDRELFAAVMAMVVITTLIGPPLMKAAIMRLRPPPVPPRASGSSG